MTYIAKLRHELRVAQDLEAYHLSILFGSPLSPKRHSVIDLNLVCRRTLTCQQL